MVPETGVAGRQSRAVRHSFNGVCLLKKLSTGNDIPGFIGQRAIWTGSRWRKLDRIKSAAEDSRLHHADSLPSRVPRAWYPSIDTGNVLIVVAGLILR